MNRALRWRIITLQVTVVVALAFVAGVAYWAADFTHSYVHDQFTAQRISFPPKGSPALDPKEFPDLQSLRAMLLNAWGWWTVGSYALYAAIGLTVAAVAVLAALVFEAILAVRRVRVPQGGEARRGLGVAGI